MSRRHVFDVVAVKHKVLSLDQMTQYADTLERALREE